MTDLVVDFCGERYEVVPDQQFTFGRAGDLRIDENRFLHRVMGICFFRSGWWWLNNAGAHLPLHLQGRIGSSSITLSAGGSVPLVLGPTTVRFAAGGTSYELLLDAPAGTVGPGVADINGETTIDAGELPLTPEQLLLLVALAEPRLRKGALAELPTNQEVIDRFAWTTTKFNRKLDNLCVKFSRRGIAGLVGGTGKSAQSRRHTLVDYVIHAGMVTVDQLSLLPPRTGSAPDTRNSSTPVRSTSR